MTTNELGALFALLAYGAIAALVIVLAARWVPWRRLRRLAPLTLALPFVVVPWRICNRVFCESLGWAPLWAPPSSAAGVDLTRLALELVALGVIGYVGRRFLLRT
jgi:hypothetical protein